jgi:hypothetical protein
MDTQQAFAGLWDSLLKHSARFAASQNLRDSCYTVLVNSMGQMLPVISWVKEIIYRVGTASQALWTWPSAYQVAFNEIRHFFDVIRNIFQASRSQARFFWICELVVLGRRLDFSISMY